MTMIGRMATVGFVAQPSSVFTWPACSIVICPHR
jgi:hypothetical protein